MKNSAIRLLILIFTISFLTFSFTMKDSVNPPLALDDKNQIEIPEDVQLILDRSCLPCHGADGSGKAKMKWNYEKMPNYDKSKLISKLVKVTEEVGDEKMPPPKNVKKNPDRKLSDEEKEIVINWADGLAESISKGSN